MTDPFSDARSGFITAEDFQGRLLLVAVTGFEANRESTMNPGKTFDTIIADVTVLDGPITEMFDHIPMKIEGQYLSGSGLVPQLKGKVGKVHPSNQILGRMTQRPARVTGFKPANVLAEPTDADKVTARAYLATLNPFE